MFLLSLASLKRGSIHLSPFGTKPSIFTTPPVYTQSDKEPAWLKWLKIAIVVIFVVVIVIVGWPFLQPFFVVIGQGIAWLVTAPLKAIGNAIAKRKRKKEDEEDYDENG